MAAEIIHGAPGSYKTSSLLSLYLIDALKANRTIITNIRGFVDIQTLNTALFKATKKEPAFVSTSEIILVPHDRDGFYKMATFFHWAPKNAIFLMDEVQQVYPSRLRTFKEFDLSFHDDPDWPLSVEAAFDKHRHMGWDIYMSTPNIKKVNSEIREVCEHAYRHKNLAGLTGFKGRYKRVQHDAENNGKSLSHATSTAYEKMDKVYFELYDSTTTGNAKDIKSGNQLFKSPKFILVVLLFVAALSSLAYATIFLGNPLSTKPKSLEKVPTADNIDKTPHIHIQASKKGASIPASDVSNGLSYSDSFSFDIVNSIEYFHSTIVTITNSKYNFTHLFSGSLGQISSDDLVKLGYSFKRLSSGMVISKSEYSRYIPFGDPNYDHSHWESSNGSVSSAQLQPSKSSDSL